MEPSTSTSLSLDHEHTQHFLELLGKSSHTSCLRAINPKPKGLAQEPATKQDPGRKHPWCDPNKVESWQREGRNVYVVINDGEQTDTSITRCLALFCEWDDREKAWQLNAWRELGLPEPTLQVDSGNRSIHSYWVFAEPILPALWSNLQARLVKHTGSDRSLKNLSRVMRLPGCYHLGAAEPVMTRIVTEAGHRYSVKELEQVLPSLEDPTPAAASITSASTTSTPTTTHQPRNLSEIKDALAYIPAAVPGQGLYPDYRNLLWGLIDACRQVGVGVDEAKELLREHSPAFAELDQVAASACDQVTAGTFWYLAKKAGWKPRPHTTKGAGKGGGRKKDVSCRLGPSEVRDILPERLGQVRLNVRTRYIHLSDRVISPDEAGLLYMELSSDDVSWPKETTVDALIYHAHQTTFDPVLEEFERMVAGVEPISLQQWNRLDQLLLGIDDPVAAAFLPRFLVSAVARLYQPGCDVHQTPVLIGPQGIGKSKLGRVLFGAAYFGEQLSTNLDKDDIIRMAHSWCLELAEMDGITRRSAIEGFKAFLTTAVDIVRRVYGRGHERIPRRTVFWGTSNNSPLRDPSGARRFVCFSLPKQPLPLERVANHRAAIWARALEQYRSGLQWWSTSEEVKQIEERNADHQQVDPWIFEVESLLNAQRSRHATSLKTPLHVSNEQIVAHLDIAKSQLNTSHYQRIRQIMGTLGWRDTRLSINGSSKRCWVPQG